MKKLFILFAVTAAGLMLKADVMYWQLGTPDNTYNGQTWNTVRVGRVATGTQTPIMSEYGYLYLTPTTNPDESSTNTSTMTDGKSAADGYFAVLPSGDDASTYSYFIELGNYNGSMYTALAQSEAIEYSNLSSSVITTAQLDDILGHTSSAMVHAWVGANYQAVPEPTSGLMVLVGLSALALRRRKARV